MSLLEKVLNGDLNVVQKKLVRGVFARDEESRKEYREITEMCGDNIANYWIMPSFTIIERRDNDKNVFETYINGSRQHKCSYTFNEQILISLELLYDGINSQFSTFAWRMLGN